MPGGRLAALGASPDFIHGLLDPEPEIVIGGEGGVGGAADDSAHLVWEVTGLARLVDGRVAVLSGGNRKLLLFEPSGRFSTSIGRGGRGPGEFSRPIHVQYLPPDTLVVWDEWFGPVSHFDTTGTLLGDRPIDLGRLMARTERRITAESALTPLLDGSFVVEVHASANPTDQTVLHSREHLRVDSTYALHSFGLWSWEVERGSVFRPAEPGFPAQVSFVDSEDTDGPIFAAGGYPPSIYISPGKKNEIHQFSPDGTLRRIIRRTTDPLPFTKEDREAGEERAIGFLIDGGVDEEVVRRVLAQANEASGTPEREFHPPISRLHLDTEGHLWVLDGVTAGEASGACSARMGGGWASSMNHRGSYVSSFLNPAGWGRISCWG